jgi:hypothetical protein
MALQAGALAIGADFQNLTTKNHQPLDSGTVTTGTFTTTRTAATSPVGVSFTAPPSGKVKVHWAAGLAGSTTGGSAFYLCTFQIRTGTTIGSGTSFVAGDDNKSLQVTNLVSANGEKQMGRTELVIALTAGNSYNVSLMFRVGAGTGTFSRVSVTLDPCIA